MGLHRLIYDQCDGCGRMLPREDTERVGELRFCRACAQREKQELRKREEVEEIRRRKDEEEVRQRMMREIEDEREAVKNRRGW